MGKIMGKRMGNNKRKQKWERRGEKGKESKKGRERVNCNQGANVTIKREGGGGVRVHGSYPICTPVRA